MKGFTSMFSSYGDFIGLLIKNETMQTILLYEFKEDA